MEIMEKPTFFPLLFRFYSHCLVFPFNELGLEMENLFRQIELQCENTMQEHLANRALDVLNSFLAAETGNLQGEYSRMFAVIENNDPLVAINFTEYSDSPSLDKLLDNMYDSDLALSYDEAPESITNLLDYFSLIVESELAVELMPVFIGILDAFGKQLLKQTTLQYYASLGNALLELNQLISE